MRDASVIASCRDLNLIKVIAVCLLITTPSLLASDPFFEPPAIGRFVLASSVGRELLKQCSRSTPRDVSGCWQPSTNAIDELEQGLTVYLQSREKAGQEIPPKGHSYHRQYVGFTRGSERFIYGNFYPASAATGFWKDKEPKLAFGVCDGGTLFWGIVYRVSTKTFEEIRFNGFA